jgi:hypothetical protein
MIPGPIPNREKGFIFDRECDEKYISVEVRISESEIERVYAIADMFQRINNKTEWREPTRILEWALNSGLFNVISECFEVMNDNGEFTEEQWEKHQERWEAADWETQHNPEMWG